MVDARRATTGLRVEVPSPGVDRRGRRRADRHAARAVRRPRGLRRPARRRRLRRDRHQGLRPRRGRSTRSPPPTTSTRSARACSSRARRASCRGKRPGDILKFNDTLPERFGERAGDEVSFQVLVKEAKRKVLPELTDEWVVGGQRVRHGRRAARRHPQPPRARDARCRRRWRSRDKVLEAAAELVADRRCPTRSSSSEMERRLARSRAPARARRA